MAANVIEIDGLTKRFRSLTAVDDVSMTVSAGEVFGLLGPNGAGKSTTLRCLLGLTRPTAGRCAILGRDCWSDRVAAHREIGVLPSDFNYEGDVTGRALLRLFASLRGADTTDRAEALAERLRADLDRPLKELSRGNHQKIGLITALAHDPELVLMDEPTSGLDPLMQEEFLRILEELRESGKTILLSSHNMAEVERACDRVAMIQHGKLLEIAEISTLLERSPKRVQAVFTGPIEAGEFASIPGVTDVSVDGPRLDLKVSGSIDAVIHAAARHELLDLICERPSLESAFVQLYREEDQ
jgi:ABC-2 type transport system ATP-binding protein